MSAAIAALAIALKRFITLAIALIAALAVYAEDIGDVAYYASCFRNVDFPLRGV